MSFVTWGSTFKDTVRSRSLCCCICLHQKLFYKPTHPQTQPKTLPWQSKNAQSRHGKTLPRHRLGSCFLISWNNMISVAAEVGRCPNIIVVLRFDTVPDWLLYQHLFNVKIFAVRDRCVLWKRQGCVAHKVLSTNQVKVQCFQKMSPQCLLFSVFADPASLLDVPAGA